MNSLKKTATIILFLSLITCFVLYKADVFILKKPVDTSNLIVSNFIVKNDSIDSHRRLIINYVFHLKLDTLQLKAEKSVVKTFTLETFRDKIIHGSKSPVLYKEYPRFKTKNKEINDKLWKLNIKRIRFTTNKVFEGIANDSDLNEVIELVENNILKSHTSLEQHIKEKEKVDFYWNRFKDYKIEVNNVNNERGVLINRIKVDSFLDHYKLIEGLKINKRSEIISSSKSIQLFIDDNELENPSPKYLMVKRMFKQIVKMYLGIEF